MSSPLPPLKRLPAVTVEAIELLEVQLALATPLASAAGPRTDRAVLLVHVVADDAEGWAECVAEPQPTYSPEFAAGAALVLRDHLVPRALAGPTGDAVALGPHLAAVRGHEMARASLELAVLDAQLRATGRSLGSWLGATVTSVRPGASLGLHPSVEALLSEADAALAAGAARLRVKIAPEHAASHLAALRAHVGGGTVLQADANGSFRLDVPEHVAELERLDGVGLACLEQPLPPDDLVGHARLAARLSTPICLDEPIASLGDLEAAVALGACQVLCLKPARVGGWIAAREVVARAIDLGLPVWVGGMLETGVGRAANIAVAALPGMALPPDLDPRGRMSPDLADPLRPGEDGRVLVPSGPGTGAVPDPAVLEGAGARVVGSWTA